MIPNKPIGFDQLNQKLLEKQKQISEKSLTLEDLREAYELADKVFDTTKARIELMIENSNPEMAEGKIIRRAKVNDEYQTAWAEYIIAKSKFKKLEMELKVLDKEIGTIEQVGNNMKREADIGKYS